MDSDHVLVLFLGLVLVGAAVALALSSPALFGEPADGVEDANLASFETTEPFCGDPNASSGSALSHEVRGGEALVLNESIPVATNDTTVSGTLEQFGPERYVLQITRETPERTPTETPTPGTATPTATPVNGTETAAVNGTETGRNGGNQTGANETTAPNGTATATATTERANATADANETATADGNTSTPTPTPTEPGSACHPKVRYNATIVLAQPEEYTVIVTYDGEFVGAHWADGEDGGSYDTVPVQPESPEARVEGD